MRESYLMKGAFSFISFRSPKSRPTRLYEAAAYIYTIDWAAVINLQKRKNSVGPMTFFSERPF